MSSLLEDYAAAKRKQEPALRRETNDAVQDLNSVYTSYKKGWSHDKKLLHVAKIHPYWFTVDPDLKMFNKLNLMHNQVDARKYLKRFLETHPECRIRPDGKSNTVRVNGLRGGLSD